MPSLNVASFNTLRARSYVFRLPLFTRAVIVAVAVFWVLDLQPLWDVRAWGALIPKQFGITTSGFPPTFLCLLLLHPYFSHAPDVPGPGVRRADLL